VERPAQFSGDTFRVELLGFGKGVFTGNGDEGLSVSPSAAMRARTASVN
jgi:hypothetical protein